MAGPVTLSVAQWLIKKVANSKGVSRLFWISVIIIGAMVVFGGVGPTIETLKSVVHTTIKQEIPEVGNLLPDSTGPVHVYFTEPNGSPSENQAIAKACVSYIDAARASIDVAAFELDNQLIIAALVRAAGRGVKVRLVTDTDYVHESGVTALRGAGVPVVDDQRDALMHNKFMVFDKKAVWTGSMNFTENCAYKNNNNGLYIESVELAENYTTKFRWMFEEKNFGSRKGFFRSEKIPHPIIKFSDGTIIESYFSPDDRIAAKVTNLVGESKKSIHFLAFSYTHNDIAKAMSDRGRAGVEVRGVFEKSQAASSYSQFSKLSALGFPVYLDANPKNMHHKVIVIDGETTLAGSFNFSDSADRSNDENALIIRNNKALGSKFEGEFKKVYDQATAVK